MDAHGWVTCCKVTKAHATLQQWISSNSKLLPASPAVVESLLLTTIGMQPTECSSSCYKQYVQANRCVDQQLYHHPNST
jgi:hypothetical protein